MGTNAWLPKIHRIPPDVDLNLQGLQQNLNLEPVPVCNVELCFPHDNNAKIHLCDECKKSNEPSVCHKLWSIWWLLVQVCLLTRECQVYQCIGQFSNRFQVLLLEVMVVQAKSWDFVQLLCLFVCQLTMSFNANFRMTFHVVGPRDRFCVKCLPVSNMFLNSSIVVFVRLASRWLHPKFDGQEMMWVHRDPRVSALFQPFFHQPRKPIRTIVVTDEQTFVIRYYFPSKRPAKPPKIVLPQEGSKWEFVQISFKKTVK